MANVYPPSPAPSACDSLADIEDLDAFLDAQGKLSRWPTPPSADVSRREVDEEVSKARDRATFDYDDEDIDEELWRLATSFTEAVTGYSSLTDYDTELVAKVLLRAQVSAEILAFAYNIIRAVGPSAEGQEDGDDFLIPDLVVTACLSLAMTFVEDTAPNAKGWALAVCRGSFPAQTIDTTVIELLLHPNLRMHALSAEHEINTALDELCEIAKGPQAADHEDEAEEIAEDIEFADKGRSPLKLAISNTTDWVYGAATPAETPIVETNSFLQLL